MSVFWFILACPIAVKLDLIGVGFAAVYSFVYLFITILKALIKASELKTLDYQEDEEDE